MKNLAKAQNSSIAPEAKAYHLILQLKELFDQPCLINCAGCDEILKCAGCSTLQGPFCCDLQVLIGEKNLL